MADNKIIKKIVLSDGTAADLDVKYWGGLETSAKQDTLISGTNIKTINGQSIIGEGNIDTIEGIQAVTYEQLNSLIKQNMLMPGQQYRITDYVTTTTQKNTISAGHKFDIIVTALDESTLSEEAKAIQTDKDHDDYFDSCNLSAWKIWYCLDNDDNRFAWIKPVEYKAEFVSIYWNDPVNGENYDNKIDNDKIFDWGTEYDPQLEEDNIVIYKSDELLYIEEDGADYGDKYFYRGVITVDGVEYDSWQKWEGDETYGSWCLDEEKGQQYALTERIVFDGEVIWPNNKPINKLGKGVIYRMIDEWGNDCPYDFKNIMFKRWLYVDGEGIADEESGDFDAYCYTFSYEEVTGNIMDASIFGNNGYLLNDASEIDGVYGNIINKSMYNALQMLNDIVFFSTYGYESGNYYGCYSNTFGYNCVRNTFGTYCHNNTFGNECNDNSFGADCYNNTFGNYCYNNIFGKECYNNDFGIFCYYNTFGTNCYNNTFGNECNDNSFSTDCYNNTFGNNCSDNIFGDTYYYNTFGNGCSYNSFMYHSNDDLIHYVSNINYGDGVSDVILSLKEDEYGFDYGFHLKNISVSKGFNSNGDYIILDANINIAHIIDSNAELTVCYNTHGDVCIFCVADLY